MEGGCWGLVIVASAFFIQVFAFGVSTSIGVYNIEFLDYFDNDTVGVSLIAAINWAVFLGSGPLCSYLMTRVTYRKIALLGAALVVVGILIMPFLPSIPAFCICFGVLSGLGSCFVYVPSHVLSGLYYDRYQSLSTGIATSGSGLGGAIMPIVIGKLIEYYGWKGSLIIVAGMELHLFALAALLRSPPPRPVETDSGDALALQQINNSKEKKADSVPDGTNPTNIVPEGQSGNAEEQTLEKESVHVEDDVNGTSVDLSGASPVQESERTAFISNSQSAEATTTNHDPGTNSSRKSSPSPTAQSKRKVKVLHNIYLFTDIDFDIYFISSILWNSTAASLLSFGPELTAERGISPINSAWLLTILGLGDFIGGILGGVIGNVWVNHRQAQYISANIAMGLCVIALPFGTTFGEFAVILACAGINFGVILGLLVVVLIDLIGAPNLGDGLGYIMLANGMGAFTGPALTGYIRQASGHYDLAFYLAGVLAILAGVIMWLIPIVHRLFPQIGTSKQTSSVNVTPV
ncbi:monocarboxylate transporter 14-like [Babylonia areolata]|uniref:monocarboxylate transporter 14-like n=1 Tax=Babylonia areolata TaxID=304850 RepID=UPI003FCF9FA7